MPGVTNRCCPGLVGVLLGVLALPAHAGEIAIVVVVNKGSTVQSLSLSELRDIYAGDRRSWQDGSSITAINLKSGSPERIAFDTIVLKMRPTDVERYWVDRRIRGEASKPKAVSSVLLLQRLVGRVQGAVGYVRANQLTQGVRPLKIDGLAHTDPAYPLKMKTKG